MYCLELACSTCSYDDNGTASFCPLARGARRSTTMWNVLFVLVMMLAVFGSTPIVHAWCSTTSVYTNARTAACLPFSQSTWPQKQRQERCPSLVVLTMGGYYKDPPPLENDENNDDSATKKKRTHMVFGTPCLEKSVALNDSTTTTSVTLLRPAELSNQEEQDMIWQREIALATFMLKQQQQQQQQQASLRTAATTTTTVTVLEEGPHRTGLTSLALATKHTSCTVKACCTDQQVWQRIQSSQWIFGGAKSLEIVKITQEESSLDLPPAACLVVILNNDSDPRMVAWQEQFEQIVSMNVKSGTIHVWPKQLQQSTRTIT